MSVASRAFKFLLSAALALHLTAATSYQVNDGTTVDITEHAVTRCVTANHASNLAVFVPTNTSTEWAAFYNNPPPGVTAGACASCTLPWGGTIAHDASVTAHQNTSGCQSGCVSQTRTCNNGTLSGTYTNQACATTLCTQNFASSGTWTRPDTGTDVVVQCWGGGGGGGRGTSTRRPKGGGGGGYRTVTLTRTSLAATVAVTIGDGGVGATGNPGVGGDGGDTTFGAHATAGGGTGGAGSGSGTTAGGTGSEVGGYGGSLYPTDEPAQNRTNAGAGGGAAYSADFQVGGTSTNGGDGGAGCEACANNGAVKGGGGGAVRSGAPAGAGGKGYCSVITGP